jgi:hypothetical protein
MYLGKPMSIIGATIDNPKGHFENKKLVRIDEIILRHYKTDWKSTKALPLNWHNSDFTKELCYKAKYILNKEFYGQKNWGFKDPRCCVTFNFWKRLFPKLRLVVTERDGSEIAHSLEKRNKKLKVENGEELVTYYLSALKENTNKEKQKVVEFSKLIDKDEQEIISLLKHFNLDTHCIEEINRFIDPRLYRSKVTRE